MRAGELVLIFLPVNLLVVAPTRAGELVLIFLPTNLLVVAPTRAGELGVCNCRLSTARSCAHGRGATDKPRPTWPWFYLLRPRGRAEEVKVSTYAPVYVRFNRSTAPIYILLHSKKTLFIYTFSPVDTSGYSVKTTRRWLSFKNRNGGLRRC